MLEQQSLTDQIEADRNLLSKDAVKNSAKGLPAPAHHRGALVW